MGRTLRLVFDSPPAIGHNSLPFPGYGEHFKYALGEQAPHVTGRERGVIPGCIPADIHTFHTHAEKDEWMNYICPNACHYPPKQAELAERKPIEEVRERAEKIADQYVWAVQAYIAKRINYVDAIRYMGAKAVLSRPKTVKLVFA